MVGQTISHYRVVSQLGAGGMGVVYAAEDPRLGRQVALKFVSEEMTKDASTIERLKVEARTTSALNHPNICTIYDIGEHDGHPFIVMEILKGRTLRDRLSEGPLKVAETIDLGIQVAEALVAAHARDIIHRDIKPANIFLVDHGPVKVLDFGLAKLTSVPGTDETVAPTADLTAIGTTVGTVSYMSPEQVSGDPLDRRTDLFSLGVVLYECVTGRQPFQGKNSAVILASILTQQPAPPGAVNASVPPGLQDAINKCLEKDRELRYQDAAGLRADLKRVKRDLDSGALRTTSTRTMAVAAAASAAAVPAPPSGVASAHSSASVAPVVPPPRNRNVPAIAAVAGIAVISIGAMMIMSRRHETAPTTVASEVAPPPAAPAAAVVQPPAPATPPAADARVESAAAARAPKPPTPPPPSPRFTAAIVEANRLLAAGDGDGATRALNVARGLDPASPAVADLSGRIVEFYRVEAARRAAVEPVRGQSPTVSSPPPSAPPQASSATPVRSPEPTPNSAPPSPPPAVTRPAVPESSPASTSLPPAQRPAPPPPAPAPAAEDDDVLIRRVIATYARAIETKDLALYRSVKPNLSAAEQRTIEEGFRSVTSQRVTVNIQSIDRRGQDAVVRLHRQDVIQAGGRQQTSESQQTITLNRASSGWLIREIGR